MVNRRSPKSGQHVGKRVIKHFQFLKRLARTRSAKRRAQLLSSASREQLLTIVEVAANILKSNFALGASQKRRLEPFAPAIRKLSRSKSEKSARSVLQQQTGGGPGLLIPLLGPVLTEAAYHLIQKFATKNKNNGS